MSGQLLEGVRLAGRVVDVVVQVDHHEVERRKNAGVRSVDHDILRVLEKLPHQALIQRPDVDAFDWALLCGAGRGLVEFENDGVRRIWRPALELSGFVVVSRNWRTALRRVSLFAADGARGIGFVGSLATAAPAAKAAKRLGVGLSVVDRGLVQRVVHPTTTYLRHDIQRWLLAERLLENHRARLVTA